jgi:hypothetical protein
MPRYLISFDAHAMDHIPDDDMPAVAKASHEVVEEALNAGVWVFGGGLENQKASIVATDGTVTDGPYPEAIGGFCVVDVPSREDALAWLPRTPAPVAARKKSGSSCPTRPWGTNRARRPSRRGDHSHMCLDRMPAVGFAGVCNQRADQARSLSTVVRVRPAVGHRARNGTASALAA